MTYSLDLDQAQREQGYDTIEQLHLLGMGDALDERLPQEAQVPAEEAF